MPHECEVVVASLHPLGFTPQDQTRNILIHSQDVRLSTAYTGVHRVHTVHKKVKKPSTASILSIACPRQGGFHPICTRIAHDKRKTIGKGDSNNWKEITKIIIKKENDCYLITIERNRKTVVTIINTVMIRASKFCSGEFTQLPMRRLLFTSFIK